MHHLIDCGMTHFHNKDVRNGIVEHNPQAKELVDSLEFGEITEGSENFCNSKWSPTTDTYA